METATTGADFGRSHPWSTDLKEHLGEFRQGHIVEDIPVFFGSLEANRLWNHPRQRVSPNGPDLTIEPGRILHRAILLTQGCDIALPKTPWVTVAPVYDATERLNSAQQTSAMGGRTRYLVHITAEWATHGFWVADLRLEMPIEKTALLTRHPLEAFADPADYPRFSTRLSDNRQRPDVPNNILESIVGPIFAVIRKRADSGPTLLAPVRELRLQLNDPLTPTTVVLFVVAADSHNQADFEGWRDIVTTVYPIAESAGLTLIGPEILTLDEMTARDYLTSVPIADEESS